MGLYCVLRTSLAHMGLLTNFAIYPITAYERRIDILLRSKMLAYHVRWVLQSADGARRAKPADVPLIGSTKCSTSQAGHQAGHPGYTAGYRGTEWVIGMIQIPARSMVIPVLLRYACLSL